MRRSTVVALILLLLVGSLYWYSLQEDNLISVALVKTPVPMIAEPGYLFESYAKDITTINIRLVDGEEISLIFSDGRWTAPTLNAVDQSAASSAAMAIEDLSILSEVEPVTSLDDFGLQPALTAEIQLSFSDGSTLSLQIGKATPTGSGYYALDESKPGRVLILPKFNLDSLLDLPINPPAEITDTFESP